MIFDTCSRYAGKGITVDEAYKRLIKYNVERKELQMSVKNAVDEIFDKTIKQEEIKKTITAEASETQPEEKTEYKKIRRRKRNTEN